MEKTRNMIERKEKVLLFSTFLKRDPKKNIISRHIYGVFRNLPPPPPSLGGFASFGTQKEPTTYKVGPGKPVVKWGELPLQEYGPPCTC